ncbi:type II toxin-antitoxin system HicB family antitoxin [Labrys wisconsinensis]|uniref:Antitoxin HicB n=1 Tax=Labrys wisconsinensis TaxID=425677 RepID=A0ABU0JL11_9HYPH|nr:type II toxin-antitoxin system HicB family antitoxin [Labrys wisconsinensis]MDQ0474151.1 antitoxin HicB [Labrys wisconsinensis]
MIGYRIELTPDDNGTLLVTCPKIPMVVTYGQDRDDALHHAVDAIEVALGSMIADSEPIPLPDTEGLVVRVSLLAALKVQLYVALRASGITRAELARRLSWNRESVDRLFRLDHASRLDQLEAAFGALGRQVDIEVREAA